MKVTMDNLGVIHIMQSDKQLLSSVNRLRVKNWSHLSITHDGETLTIYFDDVVSSAAAPLFAGNTKPLTIGKPGVADGFVGFIDDIRIWNIPRATDLLKRFESTQLTGNETGLIANIGMKLNKVIDFTGKIKAIETYGLSAATDEESSPMDVLNGPMHTYLFSGDQ